MESKDKELKIYDEDKIKLKTNESFVTNLLMKTNIFTATNKVNNYVNREFNLYSYSVKIKGLQLNNDKDLLVFLYLINKNSKKIEITFKEILKNIGIINEKTRINNERKEKVIKALEKLSTTNISIKNKDYFEGCVFNFVNNFSYDKDKIFVELNDNVFNAYKNEHKKIIDVNYLLEMNQFERSLYLLFKSYDRTKQKDAFFNLESLHERLCFESEKKYFNRYLKETLLKLKEKKLIIDYYFNKNNVLYVKFINKKSNEIFIENMKKIEKIELKEEDNDIPNF